MSWIVGIDLGTSNCAVAFADSARGIEATVEDFSIPQLQRLGEVAARALLPSCVYLPAAQEFPPDALRLPWADSGGRVVGEFARWQGARVPGRLVVSAKSWLSHAGVDRAAPILPWGAPPDVPKISPVSASAEYLRHIAAAWESAHPEAPLARQEVVITVPASFDEVARALTVNAAREAGLGKFALIEEPQAAFYDFTSRHRRSLAAALEHVRLVLVVDVGGGTTDFTLVQVAASDEGPALRRIAVGEHLMLGGDNMDAAFARLAEERMTSGGRKLSSVQWTQLVQVAREAKEKLLSTDAPETARLALAAEGSKLFGSTSSAQISRDEAARVIVEGFFPFTARSDFPQRPTRAALQELGLPYAQDPAITRHLAEFLRKHADAGFAAIGITPGPDTSASEALFPRPDAILLNGGVFNSGKLAERLVEVVSRWWPENPPIPLLPHTSLDLAVARGAAYYGLVRHGLGRRISGGSAHALYAGVGSTSDTARPQAICVIPRGHEEGETVELRERSFQLTLGRPVQFPLYSTASDRVDRAGEVVSVTDELQPLPPIHTLLKSRRTTTDGAAVAPRKRPGDLPSQVIPVFLRATLTEIGTLELSCVSAESNEQWRLEFELRGAGADKDLVVTESMPARFSEAKLAVEHIFTPKGKPAPAKHPAGALPKDVKQLWTALERTLGPRASWSLPVLRELWTALFAGVARRRRSADHERVFFQLLGYALRPGFGYPLDEWRCTESFRLFGESVEFHKEKPNWTEFWILWRRIAAGLNEAQQRELWDYLEPHLQHRLSVDPKRAGARPKGIQPEGTDEMVRAAASLEHLAPDEKIRLGEWILPRLTETAGGPWAWSIGRLGARVPVRASSHKVVTPDVASHWLEQLLSLDWGRIDGAAFAAAQIARMSGDRARDVSDSVRQRVVEALRQATAPGQWIRGLTEVVALEKADEARVLGDTLPAGLQMLAAEPE